MNIRKIKAANFRKHEASSINIENDLTVLVGENDTGKSSFIDAIKIVLNDERIQVTDFLDRSVSIKLEVHAQDEVYMVIASLDGESLHTKRFVAFEDRVIAKLRNSFESMTEENLRYWCKKLGIRVASNSRLETLKSQLQDKITDRSNYGDGNFLIESSQIPDIKVYFLSGVQFESIEKFIHETFFRSRQREIWNTPIENTTLSDFIQDKLLLYKTEAESEIEHAGVISIMRQYIPDLKTIEINPIFDKKDVSINLSVQILTQSGERQSVSRFGDGTRRRLTIALLEHKAKTETEGALYLFDEPDTHLHVKAQNELLDALDLICETGNQIITTTHSPFIMNSVDTRQIRIINKYKNVVRIRTNIAFESLRDDEFRRLGIENLHLFFSRKFIIVEGETEEAFIPIAYRKFYGRPISRDFIKIINRRGIDDVPKFAEAMTHFVSPDDVYIIIDNDALPRTQELINALKTPNVYQVGRKEFEDAFSPEIIYRAWEKHVNGLGGMLGSDWNSDSITELAFDEDTEKFSKHLRQKNAGCMVQLTKPSLGIALANYCEMHHLPDELQVIMKVLNSEINDQ